MGRLHETVVGPDLDALIPGWLHAGVRLAGLLPLHVVLRDLWVVSMATVGLDLNRGARDSTETAFGEFESDPAPSQTAILF